MTSNASSAPTPIDVEAITARLAALEASRAAREERIKLLEEENRWLKAQLFGRSSEKRAAPEISPDERWLFNEIEALSDGMPGALETITIPAHGRGKRGRRKLGTDLPRIEIVHDLAENEKLCPRDGTALERIGEEICEQLEVIPAKVRVLRHIRPKYVCPCCRQGVRIAPPPVAIFRKSIATPSLLAQIITGRFVDGIPLYRQEPQFGRMGISLHVGAARRPPATAVCADHG